MECTTVEKMMNAWVDGEIGPEDRQYLTEHLAQCPACRQELRQLEHVAAALDGLAPIHPPKGFSARTLRAFRAGVERPGFSVWWRNMSFAMRGAACAVVLAGLLSGAVLGASIATLDYRDGDPYRTLYVSQGVLP